MGGRGASSRSRYDRDRYNHALRYGKNSDPVVSPNGLYTTVGRARERIKRQASKAAKANRLPNGMYRTKTRKDL